MTEPTPLPQGATVLVTGATGFIGTHLTARLKQYGATVHGASRFQQTQGSYRWHQVDLEDPEAVVRLLDATRPDFIFHLASMVTGARDRDFVLPTFRANLMSTVNLLDAVIRVGCQRLIQLGSLEEPSNEDESKVPSSPYAASKAAATSYARMYHELYDLPTAIAKVFMVYGPGPQEERRLVPYVVRSLLAGDSPRLSSGTREVDWIFVDDVVTGLIRLATAEGAVGSVLDIGSGELVTVREVVQRLFRILGRTDPPAFGSIEDRAREQIRRADVSETTRRIGWRPTVSLDAGLQQTVEWFRNRQA